MSITPAKKIRLTGPSGAAASSTTVATVQSHHQDESARAAASLIAATEAEQTASTGEEGIEGSVDVELENRGNSSLW